MLQIPLERTVMEPIQPHYNPTLQIQPHFNHNDFQDVGLDKAVTSQGLIEDTNKWNDKKSDMQSIASESPPVHTPSTNTVSFFYVL